MLLDDLDQAMELNYGVDCRDQNGNSLWVRKASEELPKVVNALMKRLICKG